MKVFSNPGNKTHTSLCNDAPCIIDASSLIAYLEGKPKGVVIQRIMEQSHSCGAKIKITALDMFLVYLKGITDHPDSFTELMALLDQLPIQVEPVTKESALEAARLMAEHQGLEPNTGISSYLTKTMDGTLITADPVVHNQKILPGGQIVYVGDDTGAG